MFKTLCKSRGSIKRCCVAVFAALIVFGIGCADPTGSNSEKSVHPGINDSYKNPDVAKYVGRFETESREIYRERHRILDALEIETGMHVADVGAGTGLFSLPLAKAVGPDGRVFAVDIVPKFLERIDRLTGDQAITNVTTVLCTERSIEVPSDSVDLVFVCDTYHHFEYPMSTMTSLHEALKPGGEVVLVDFIRDPEKSDAWVLKHVRAGQEVVIKEVESVGFQLVDKGGHIDYLRKNYVLRFRKAGETG